MKKLSINNFTTKLLRELTRSKFEWTRKSTTYLEYR